MSDIETTIKRSKVPAKPKRSPAKPTDAALAPVITIDGPSGSGKGTIASAVAEHLAYNYLDSGALYRVMALASLNREIAADDVDSLVELVMIAPVTFKRSACGGSDVLLEGEIVTSELRREEVGLRASQIATIAPFRTALLDRQLRWRRPPGLVADGRDMGTVVFPDAPLKIYLTASAEIRAQRRHKQLIEKGIEANIVGLLADINERDDRDYNREIAPLVAAADAITIDSSTQTIEEVVTKVLDFAGNRL